MTTYDMATFNEAVALANRGDKQQAHYQLRQLLTANPNDPNLLLWLAFTSPDLDQAGDFLDTASAIDGNSPSLAQAKNWLAQERAKQPPVPLTFVSSPSPFQQQTAYQPQPQQYAPTAAVPVQQNLGNLKILFGIIIAGGLITILSVFLSWVVIDIPFGPDHHRVYLTGLGVLSGDHDLLSNFKKYGGTPDFKDGVFVLIAAIPFLLLSIGGFLRPKKIYASGLLIFGLAGMAFYANDMRNVDQVFIYLSAAGPGMFIGSLGCIIMVIAATVILLQKKPG